MALVFPLMLFINTGFFIALILSAFIENFVVSYHAIMNSTVFLMEIELLLTIFALIKLNLKAPKGLYYVWMVIFAILSYDLYWPFIVKNQMVLNAWCLSLVLCLVASMKGFPYKVASRLMFAMLFYAMVLIMIWFSLRHRAWLPAVFSHNALNKGYFAFARYLELAAVTTFFYSFFLYNLLVRKNSA